jgi:hypothetical protein
MSDKPKSRKIGSIRNGKYGYYLKLDDDITLMRDGEEILLKKNCLNIQSPWDIIDYLEDNGYITKEQAEERLANLDQHKEWLKYEIFIPKAK